jgi:hypothetical protein
LNNRFRDWSVSCVKTIASMLAVLAVAFGVRVSAAFDFVGFLKNPVPIRKVVYWRAGEAFQVNGQHLTHPVLFEGGIDSDTWYERTLPTPESQVYYQQFGTCRGCSRKGEGWFLDATALAGQGGYVGIGSGATIGSRSESFLVEIQMLGLTSLEPASIEESEDRFTALYRPEDWPANTNRISIEGRIERNARRLPSRVLLTGFRPPVRSAVVKLSYAETIGDSFPSTVEAELEMTDGKPLRIPLFEIQSIEFGRCESPDGYVASMFLPTKPKVDPLIGIHQEGRTLLLGEHGVFPIETRAGAGPRRGWRGLPPVAWVAGGGCVVAVVALGWWRWSRLGRSRSSVSGSTDPERRSSRGD